MKFLSQYSELAYAALRVVSGALFDLVFYRNVSK